MSIDSWSDSMNVKNAALGARIKQARKTLGMTQHEFAQRLAVTQPTVHRWEKGFYEPDEQVLRRLAEMTRLSPAYLRYGENGAVADSNATVQILGYVGAGAEIRLSDQRSFATPLIGGPPSERQAMAALQVRGDHLYPVYQDGDVVFYAPDAGAGESEFLGRECVVRITGGGLLLKRVMRGAQPGRYTLISYNAPPMNDVQLDHAAPIRWIRRS